MADQTVITNDPSEDVTVKPTSSWKSYLWDTFDLPKEERWLLFKLDACVLTFSSIGYFLKYLDLNNVTNAYLSGMEEDLEMFGNQLVTSTSIFTVGYVIGQVPFNLLLTRVSPRWVIPSLEVGWGMAVICMSSVKSYQALYVLRFLVGIFESGFYPGIHYMLGSWYKPSEIGKRAMIFWIAGSIGQLFSGFLQSAAYTNLDGVYGRAGWRWLFIIDGIITFPLAVAGYFFFPNLPHSGIKTWYITEEEQEISIQRMKSIGRAGKAPWTRAKVKALLTSWHTYLLPMIYVIWNNGAVQPAMGYWLKSFNTHPPPVPGTHFSIPQINNLPNITLAIFIVMALIWGWLSDGLCRGARWPFIYIGAVITLLFSILLRQMPLYDNIHGRMVVFWLSNIGGGAGPLILTWINEICTADTEKRAITVALANDLAYVVQAVAPNFVWKTTDFPAARKGYLWSIILQVLLIVLTAVVQFLLWHDSRKEAPRKYNTDSSEVDSDDLVSRLSKEPDLKGATGRSRVVPDVGHQV
ncbi:Pantothenate transporter liz1 [Talaromyces pinophilus]|nr:Pantothenate transporter liz1 [Talaromyces pinophilus]